jgi:3-aminobutyryl-CoA ammonia-lyase
MKYSTKIRLRIPSSDAHYAGNLVGGASVLSLFGDVATELLVMSDGDEGLFRAYKSVEFLAPVYAGDIIEAEGEITEFGNTSRTMSFTARKLVTNRFDIGPSAAEVLEEPVIVCIAEGVCVVPLDCQRKKTDRE